MTETTEEKDPFEKAKTHICGLPGFSEYFDYIRARKGHQPPTNDFLNALSKYITSLTKERDELKEKIEPNEYYCTACRDCNWEGSSKFLRVSQFDECDITCPCCHSKNLVDTNIELNDNQSISNLHEYIDMQEFRISSIKSTSRVIANHNAHLKSQLSNRDEEIKELEAQQGWKDIWKSHDCAPKNGDEIVAILDDVDDWQGLFYLFFHNGEWWSRDGESFYDGTVSFRWTVSPISTPPTKEGGKE